MASREPSCTMQSLGAHTFAPILIAGDATLAMRASSWGDVGEYGRFAHAHEVSSLHSGAGDHDEPLDPDVFVVGAGGVATSPLPPTPSASAGVLAPGGLAPPYVTPAEVLCRVAPLPSPPLTAGSASRGSHGSGFGAVASAMANRWHSPPRAPRSLMQLSSSYSSEEHRSGDGVRNGDEEGDGGDDGSDGDSDSFFARNSEEAPRPCIVRPTAPRAVLQHDGSYEIGGRRDDDGGDGDDDGDWGCGTQEHGGGLGRGKNVYGEDDDDNDASDGDSGGPPIEVRRRRPSWAVHDDYGDDGDNDEDEGGGSTPPQPQPQPQPPD
jgi:hypothetical protein